MMKPINVMSVDGLDQGCSYVAGVVVDKVAGTFCLGLHGGDPEAIVKIKSPGTYSFSFVATGNETSLSGGFDAEDGPGSVTIRSGFITA